MKLRVNCGALTRMEYSCVVEVPDGTPEHQFSEIARRIYDDTDAGDFSEDYEYWERGECWAEKVEDETPVSRPDFVLEE